MSSDHQNPVRRPRLGAMLAVGGAIVLLFAGTRLLERDHAGAIEALLRDLAKAVSASPADDVAMRRTRIQTALNRHVSPEARLRIAELSHVDRPGDPLVEALTNLVQPGEQAAVELTRMEIEAHDRTATAKVDVRLASDTGRDLHAPHRLLLLRLTNTSGRWKVMNVDVPAEAMAEPEARP